MIQSQQAAGPRAACFDSIMLGLGTSACTGNKARTLWKLQQSYREHRALQQHSKT